MVCFCCRVIPKSINASWPTLKSAALSIMRHIAIFYHSILTIIFKILVHHLGQNASIVYCPDFEIGVSKVLKGQVKLTQGEKLICSILRLGRHLMHQCKWPGKWRSLRGWDWCRKISADGSGVETNKRTKCLYCPLIQLCPTSIVCESLFSDAKHIVTAGTAHGA